LLFAAVLQIGSEMKSDASDEDAIRSFTKADLEAFLQHELIMRGDELRADFLRKSLDQDTATRWTVKQLMTHPYMSHLVPEVSGPGDFGIPGSSGWQTVVALC
jgi:serine/threonine protein kinase